MTDRELAAFGERLYEAVRLTPLPAGSILALATAIRYNAGWSELPRALRFAVFKIAAACHTDRPEPQPGEGGDQPQPPAAGERDESPATPAGEARATRPGADEHAPGGAEEEEREATAG
jgi:hypothetical protein